MYLNGIKIQISGFVYTPFPKIKKKKPIHLAYFENSLQLPQDSENKEVQIFDIFTLSAENSRAPGQIQLL